MSGFWPGWLLTAGDGGRGEEVGAGCGRLRCAADRARRARRARTAAQAPGAEFRSTGLGSTGLGSTGLGSTGLGGTAGWLRQVAGAIEVTGRPGLLPGRRDAGRRHERPVGGHFLPVVSIGKPVPLGAWPVTVDIPPAAGLAAARLGAGLLTLRRTEVRLVVAVVIAPAAITLAVITAAVLAHAVLAEAVLAEAVLAAAGPGAVMTAAIAARCRLEAGPGTPCAASLAGNRPAAGRTAPGRRWRIREVVAFGVSHMPHSRRDSNENDHDNDCQADHERSHRTIQQALTLRAAQARHARPPTRAFPKFCLRPGRIRDWSLNSDSVGPLWPLSCDSRSLGPPVYSPTSGDYPPFLARPDNGLAVAVSLPLAIALRAIAVQAAFALVPLRSRSGELNA